MQIMHKKQQQPYWHFVLICNRHLFVFCFPSVTEKAYESESYSEADEDVQAAKPAPKNPVPPKPAASNKEGEKRSHKKTAASANKGAKQASIMGFFHKK